MSPENSGGCARSGPWRHWYATAAACPCGAGGGWRSFTCLAARWIPGLGLLGGGKAALGNNVCRLKMALTTITIYIAYLYNELYVYLYAHLGNINFYILN